IIRGHNDCYVHPEQVMPPDLECFNNGEELLIMRLIIHFRREHLPRPESDGVPQPPRLLLLGNYPCKSKPRSIGFHPSWLRRVVVSKHRSARERLLQLLKGFLSLRRKLKGAQLLAILAPFEK